MPGRLRCYHAALRLDFGRLIKAYEMGRLAAVMVIAPRGRDQHPRIKNDPFGRRGPGVVTGGRGGGCRQALVVLEAAGRVGSRVTLGGI